MAVYNHFYELSIYKNCREFRKKISAIVYENFPKAEIYLLTSQVLRSCRSVTANIAEGFGRFHHQENIQFCRQSRGSLSETMEHMITAYDEKYISKEKLSEIADHYKKCLRELNQYIKYLKSAKTKELQ